VGTDSVWYGSPQWQIEALRRLEIPGRHAKNTASRRLAAPIAGQQLISHQRDRLYRLN